MNIHRIRQKQQNIPFHHRKNIFKILSYFRRDRNTNSTFLKMLKHSKPSIFVTFSFIYISLICKRLFF